MHVEPRPRGIETTRAADTIDLHLTNTGADLLALEPIRLRERRDCRADRTGE
jgi:hypothetical protein